MQRDIYLTKRKKHSAAIRKHASFYIGETKETIAIVFVGRQLDCRIYEKQKTIDYTINSLLLLRYKAKQGHKDMTTRQSFFEATKLNNIWNKVIVWNGLTLSTVMWHNNKEWKLVENGATFDDVKQKEYKDIASFHTQAELWQYIKENYSF